MADKPVQRVSLKEKLEAYKAQVASAFLSWSAAYGAVAYELGLQDGIRLASEVKAFE